MDKRTWFTTRQKKFLELVAKKEAFRTRFYLTGGTALSAVYLNHRESYDLDFFSSHEFSSNEVGRLVASARRDLGWIGLSRDVNFPVNIFVIKWEDGSSLKIDFNFYAFKRLKKGRKVFGISVDSIEDIAANKLDAIFSRRQARDYVDIYSIIKETKLDMRKIIELHRKKFEMLVDNLTWTKVFLLVNEAVDYPEMRIKFNKNEMIKFFENEARKLESKIFKD